MVAIATLALGAGADTAIFAVIDAVLLRPMPLPESNRLALAYSKDPQGRPRLVSYADFQDWRRQSRLFETLSAAQGQSVSLTGLDEPTRIRGGFVSAEFFETVGVAPVIGRGFRSNEDSVGAERVAVLSYGLWQTRFGGDRSILARKLMLDGEPASVIGVLPANFQFPLDDVDVWLPYSSQPGFSPARRDAGALVLGRLRRDVSTAQAQAELESIAAGLARQYPETNQGRGALVEGLQHRLTRDLRPTLQMLFGAVGFVMLIACANVANLSLARALARRREWSIRTALGASRGRLLLQLLGENLTISLTGGGIGLLLGWWGAAALIHWRADMLPRGVTAHLDWSVGGFTLAVSVLAGIGLAWMPSLEATRKDLSSALRDGGRAASGGATLGRARRLLVLGQVALCVILLAGAGLLLKAFLRVSAVDPGFDPRNLLTLEYRLPLSRYAGPDSQWRFHQQVVERVRALPGVRSAAELLALPFSGNAVELPFELPDRPAPQKVDEPRALVNRADPYLFETMGIRLVAGRMFNARDRVGTAPVAIVSQSMAQRYWPGRDAIGRQVKLAEFTGEPAFAATIVGISGDVKHERLEEPGGPQIWIPFAQHPFPFATLVIRTEGSPLDLANSVRSAIWSLDKNQPVWKVRTLDFLLDQTLSQRRFAAWLLGAFSLFALLLAAVGLYGVISYAVSRRTREIGVRIALGANQADVAALVAREALALTGGGLALGIAGALGLRHLLQAQLYGVSSADPSTIAAVCAVLAAVALMASYLPARRAMRIDPAAALRE